MAEKKTQEHDNKVAAELRDSFGKGAARRLRAAGRIPAVIYGHGSDPQHVSLPGHEVGLILRKANAILDLDIAGKKELALVKDVQKDPVRQIIEHLDLIIVKKGEKVHVEVPVHVQGESFSGTMVMLDLPTLRIEVEATRIPENVSVDVEGAEEGTQILAKDVVLPAGASLLDDPEAMVLNVVVPTAAASEDEAAPEATDEAAAPEAAEAGDEAEASEAE